jgi:bifunctional DNA-binding transcriptional regulator/antitoxin component of YhaV-PrlF toxin-antitoxin module
MTTSTLTRKGQTTVPLEIRRALKLKPRQRIEWVRRADGSVLVRPLRSVGSLAGSLRSRVPFPGLEQEKEAAAEAWAARSKTPKERA